ncbi:MAG TPA: hypothetical protein VK871_10010 [Candidatus Limnocylindrales bacterium]|nr:hypothetical protein [Candidatus Limnocylindrales bacterium]
MKRFLIALMAGAMVFAVAFAAAATLSVNGGTIQYGEDNSLTCTASANVNGWGADADTGTTTYVRITYDPACAGNDMFVRVTDASNAVIAAVQKVPLDASGSTGNLTFTTPLDNEAIDDIHILIEGPGGTPNQP